MTDGTVRTGDPENGETVSAADFREALSCWASGVVIAAVRDPDGGRVYATTATAFSSASLDPPLVLLGLGAGAQVLPFLEPGARFAISVLGADQRRYATVFADPFPVGPSPFPETGAPLIEGSIATLECVVDRHVHAGDHVIVLARVEAARASPADAPLIRYRRDYHVLGEAGRI